MCFGCKLKLRTFCHLMSYFLDICGCILRSPKKVDSTQYYIKLTTKIHFRTDLHLPCTSLRITRSGNCFNLAVRLCLTSMRCNDVRTTSFCCQCPLGKSPRRPIGALNFSITLSFSARISCVCVGGGGGVGSEALHVPITIDATIVIGCRQS